MRSTIGILKNSRLLLYDEDHRHMSPTQTILEQCYQGTRPVVNRNLLDRLYGPNHSHAYGGITRKLISITKRGKELVLTPSLSEAVRRYEDCPAFVLTGPPGSGKTLVAAAMATSYCGGGGNQLVLVPSPSGLAALAQALVALDTTNKAFVLLDEDGEVESLHGKEDMDMEQAALLTSDTTGNQGSQHIGKDQEIDHGTGSVGGGNIFKKGKDEAHITELNQPTSKNCETFWELDNRRNENDEKPHIIVGTVDTVLKMMANQIRKDGSMDARLQSIPVSIQSQYKFE